MMKDRPLFETILFAVLFVSSLLCTIYLASIESTPATLLNSMEEYNKSIEIKESLR